jgi:hypothetical protein
MPRVGFEPTIPAFERAKTVHDSGPAATVIGKGKNNEMQINQNLQHRILK